MTQPRKMTHAQIVAAYGAGMNLREIGAKAGYTHEGVRVILKRNGVQMRPRSTHSGSRAKSCFAHELLTDLPTLAGPVTLDTLTDWFGADPDKLASTVKGLFLKGKIVIGVAP